MNSSINASSSNSSNRAGYRIRRLSTAYRTPQSSPQKHLAVFKERPSLTSILAAVVLLLLQVFWTTEQSTMLPPLDYFTYRRIRYAICPRLPSAAWPTAKLVRS